MSSGLRTETSRRAAPWPTVFSSDADADADADADNDDNDDDDDDDEADDLHGMTVSAPCQLGACTTNPVLPGRRV